MLKKIIELPFEISSTILKCTNTEIYVLRPKVLSKRFKEYDPEKNFQIWLKESGKQFRPNHLRVMVDLNLRVRTEPDLKEKLLLAFDNIFYGQDPDKAIEPIKNEKFQQCLNELRVIAYLSQLFIIEQEIGYNKESKFEPPTLFYQGWLREFLDNNKEVDNLCMSVCSRRPPSAKYINKENKKNNKFEENLEYLWYLK